MKSIKFNAVLNIIKTIMTIAFPMISFPYASRVLGVAGIGNVQYATSVISYFVLIAGLGINTYAVREGSRIRDNKAELKKFSTEIFIINLMSMLLSYFLLLIFIILDVFKIEMLLMVVSSLSIVGTTFAVDWFYQIKENYMAITVRSICFQLLSLILMFVFVRDTSDYIFYALANVIASCGYCIFNFYYAKEYIHIRSLCKKIDFKKHIKPILMIFSISIASSIYLNLDTVMLGIMIDKYAVGLYTVAVKLNSIIRMLVTSIGVVVLPRLSYFLHKGYKDEYYKMLKVGININLLLSIPCSIGMVLLSKYIIIIFSGADFLDANLASQILSINMIFSIFDNLIYYQVLLPFRMEKMASIGTLVGALSNVVLNLILIPKFSINGAAVATLISECLVCFVFIMILRNKLNLFRLLKDLWKFLVAALIMGLCCELLMVTLGTNILSIILNISFSGLIYFAFLFILKVPEIKNIIYRLKEIIYDKI